jgi:hypothetical protein
MYKNVLASIPGIEYYPIVALVIFFAFFAGLIIWYFRTDVAWLQTYAAAIVDDDMPAPSENVSPSSGRS